MDFIFKWQTLIGATLGGIIGLLSALVVASSARRREEISSAMVLVSNLAEVTVASQALRYLMKEEDIRDNQSLWLAEKLASHHPTLSPMFETCVARVMPVSGTLASHLELFRKNYSYFEMILECISDDYEAFGQTNKAPRSREEMTIDAEKAVKSFDKVVKHATCAEDLLFKLILSRTPTFNRIRISLYKTRKERDCQGLFNNRDTEKEE